MQHDPNNPIPGFLPDPPQASTQGAWAIPVIAGVVTIPLLMLLWGVSQQQQPVTAQTQPVTDAVTTPAPTTEPRLIPNHNPGIPIANAATVAPLVTTPVTPEAIATPIPSVAPSPIDPVTKIGNCNIEDWINLRQTAGGTVIAQIPCGFTVTPNGKTEAASGITWHSIQAGDYQGWVAQDYLVEVTP